MRKKLIEAGVEVLNQRKNEYDLLRKKIETMKESGLSYQTIANHFNLWKIPTRTREGKWHAKTVRDLIMGRQAMKGGNEIFWTADCLKSGE